MFEDLSSYLNGPFGDYTRSTSKTEHDIRIVALGMQFTITTRWQNFTGDGSSEATYGGGSYIHQRYLTATIQPSTPIPTGGGDVSTAAYSAIINGPTVSASPTDSVDLAGTWSVTLDVQECVSFGGGGDAFGFPNWGGVPSKDPPLYSTLRLYEQPLIAGSFKATLNIFGQSLATHIVITSANRSALIPTYVLTITPTLRIKNYTSTLAITGAIGTTSGGSGVSGTGTLSAASATTDFSSGVSLTCATGHVGTGINPPQPFYRHSAVSSIVPPKIYNLSGVIRALGSPYPSSVDMLIDAESGMSNTPFVGGSTFSYSRTQENYTFSSSLNNGAYAGPNTSVTVVPSTSKSTFLPVRVWLRPGASGDGYANSLLALGEDTTDWPVTFRTFHWSAATLSHTGVQAVDPSPSPANWTPTNATLGSGMTITVGSSGTGSITSPLTAQAPAGLKGSSFSGVSFSGYRTLRLYLTAGTAAQPARITLGSKTWDVTVSTSGSIDIDLCAPHNSTATVDAQDTKWPYASTAPVVVTDGDLWGVTNVSALTISNLAAGQVYTLSGIELRRIDHSRAYWLPVKGDDGTGWILRESPVTSGGTVTTTKVRRFLDVDVDGRRAREIEGYSWVHVDSSGSPTDTFGATPLSTLVGNSSYPLDGFTGTDLRPNPGSAGIDVNGDTLLVGWLNSDQPLECAFGAGAYCDASGWMYGWNQDLSSGLTVPGQVLAHTIDWYPDCGDAFNFVGGGYGSTIELRAAKILRSDAWGIVLDSNHAVASGHTITLKAGTVNRGTGVSVATTGEYETSSPWALGGSTATASDGTHSSTAVYPSRMRRRVAFTVATAFGNPYNAHHDAWGMYLRTWIQGGNVLFSLAFAGYPVGGFDIMNVQVTSSGNDSDPRVEYDRTGAQRLLCTFARKSGSTYDIYQTYSTDEGRTWYDPVVVIPGGKHPTPTVGNDGTTLVSGYVGPTGGPGAISCAVRAQGDASYSSPFNLKDSTGTDLSVEDDTFGISQAKDGAHRWILAVVIAGDSGVSEWFSTDWDARTWTRTT